MEDDSTDLGDDDPVAGPISTAERRMRVGNARVDDGHHGAAAGGGLVGGVGLDHVEPPLARALGIVCRSRQGSER